MQLGCGTHVRREHLHACDNGPIYFVRQAFGIFELPGNGRRDAQMYTAFVTNDSCDDALEIFVGRLVIFTVLFCEIQLMGFALITRVKLIGDRNRNNSHLV